MNYDDMPVIDCNPTLAHITRVRPEIQYSNAHDDCRMLIVEPCRARDAAPKHRPLVVFVQGCAWMRNDIHARLPMLSALAGRSYVVATVRHRSIKDGFAFPTYLKDVKTAIRYLRANKDEFDIDPERVCVWGTSSGGNTAMLILATAEDARYRTEEYADQKDGAQTIVDCFGPTDMYAMRKRAEDGDMSLVNMLAGACDVDEVIKEMSPLLHLKPNVLYPPSLLMHGDADDVVPFEQSVLMCEKLRALGCASDIVRIKGGEHEGNFWSENTIVRAFDFIDRTIGKA